MRPKSQRILDGAVAAVQAHARELSHATPRRQRELLAAIAQVAGQAAWGPETPDQIGVAPPLRIQADRGDREGDR